jgi:hypothetical protein
LKRKEKALTNERNYTQSLNLVAAVGEEGGAYTWFAGPAVIRESDADTSALMTIVVGQELVRQVVPPEKSGLDYPVDIVVLAPDIRPTPIAALLSDRAVDSFGLTAEAITWEDAAWH